MSTLLLTRSDVEASLDGAALVPLLRAAFVAYAGTPPAERARRVRASVTGGASATVLFPGVAAGVPAYTVKVHAKFPGAQPAIRGVVCLHDTGNGALLAVMDSTYLTAVRTGVAGALAADVLARADADAVAVIGAGVQGEQQLRALAGMRRLRSVQVYDSARERAVDYAGRMTGALGVRVDVATSVPEALATADIVLTATWARTPFITAGMLRPGTHVTTLGADEPGKAEVAADVIRDALFVCDDRALAVEMGALAGVGLGDEIDAVELGDVLGGRLPGRTSADEITVYGGVGLAFQDAVAAWLVYERATAAGRGRRIDLLA